MSALTRRVRQHSGVVLLWSNSHGQWHPRMGPHHGIHRRSWPAFLATRSALPDGHIRTRLRLRGIRSIHPATLATRSRYMAQQ